MKLLTLANLKTVPEENGVYKIYAKLDGRPFPVKRIFGTDGSGLLYVGKGEGKSGVRARLMSFRRRAFLTSGNHSGGWKFKSIPGYKAKFKETDVYFSFELHDDASDQEMRELNNYRQKYGEVPPLNG